MKAYQLKISIKGSKPLLWRRVVVPAGISFDRLHEILIVVMGWQGGHLYEFDFPDFGMVISEAFDFYDHYKEALSAGGTKIDELLEKAERFNYIYDLGDNWEHNIIVEKVLNDYKKEYPTVLKASGNCPPEDCGGIDGYYAMTELLQNPEHPEHEHFREWAGSRLSEPYNIRDVNLYFKEGFATEQEAFSESLFKMLSGYKKQDLQFIADMHELKGYSRYVKEKLGHFVASSILSDRIMMPFLINASEDEISLFESCMAGPQRLNREMESEIAYFVVGGYCMIKGDRVFIPPEVKLIYRDMDKTCLAQARKRHMLIVAYIKAATHLYGIVPLETLKDIFNRQNHEPTVTDEILGSYRLLAKRNPDIVHYQDSFADAFLFMSMEEDDYDEEIEEWRDYDLFDEEDDEEFFPEETDEGFVALLDSQGDKPFYIPSKDQFLKYTNPEYVEETKEYKKFREFIVKKLGGDKEDAKKHCVYIQLAIRLGYGFGDVMGILQDADMSETCDQRIVKEFGDLFVRLWENSRMLAHRGHTPAEMGIAERGKVIPFDPSRRKSTR